MWLLGRELPYFSNKVFTESIYNDYHDMALIIHSQHSFLRLLLRIYGIELIKMPAIVEIVGQNFNQRKQGLLPTVPLLKPIVKEWLIKIQIYDFPSIPPKRRYLTLCPNISNLFAEMMLFSECLWLPNNETPAFLTIHQNIQKTNSCARYMEESRSMAPCDLRPMSMDPKEVLFESFLTNVFEKLQPNNMSPLQCLNAKSSRKKTVFESVPKLFRKYILTFLDYEKWVDIALDFDVERDKVSYKLLIAKMLLQELLSLIDRIQLPTVERDQIEICVMETRISAPGLSEDGLIHRVTDILSYNK